MEISASFKNRPVALKAGILWLTALLAFQTLLTFPVPAGDVKASNRSYETISSASLKAKESYGKLPLSFEENRGQADSRVKFISHGDGYTLFLTATEAVLKLRAGRESIRDREDKLSGPNPTVSNQQFSVLRVKLAGGASSPQAEGIDRLPGNNNYLIGGDPEKWRTQVPTYARVRYSEVYPGIDMIYYGDQRQLEYDFVLAPGADSRAIRLAFEGTRELRLDEQGDLLLETRAGEIRQRKPFAYQIANGIRQEVAVSYCIKSRKEVRFQLGAYDAGRQLIIDPVLSYSTFLGGSGFDQGNDIAVDSDGNVYVTGYTLSADFPVMKDVFQNASGSSSDVFVAKLNPAGTALIYSTYLGGESMDMGEAIAVDSSGNVYIAGETFSDDFPATPNAVQPFRRGFQDAFVAKIDPVGGTLVYSTYLGGNATDDPFCFSHGLASLNFALDIAVDSFGNAYVTGNTNTADFPTTANALKTGNDGDCCFFGSVDPDIFHCTDAFVTKLNESGTALIYSTYLGGKGDDAGRGIAVDPAGNAYVTGNTEARDFPTMNALQPASGGRLDAFVAKLNQKGSALLYSTYFGGISIESGNAITVNPSGNAYITGAIYSTELPATPGALQPINSSAIAFKSTDGGSRWFQSHRGLPGNINVAALAVDPSNSSRVYAGTSLGIFISEDGGNSWSLQRDISSFGPVVLFLGFHERNPATAYVMTDLDFFFPAISKTTDGGLTWNAGGGEINSPNGIARNIRSVKVDPTDDSILYAATDVGFVKSTNNGGSWSLIGKGIPDRFGNVLAIDSTNSSTLYAESRNILFKSTNGGKRWQKTGLGNTPVQSVTFDPRTPSTVYATGVGIFKSTDSGETWQTIENNLPFALVGRLLIDPANPSIIYTSSFKSTDGGRNWQAIAIAPLAIDPNNMATLYGGGSSGSDAFVAKLNASGSAFSFFTYLGGGFSDSGTAIALGAAGHVYVTGMTSSRDFPVKNGFQPDLPEFGFVAKLNPSGTDAIYSSYLGGASIAVDDAGSAYLVGIAFDNFPTKNALQPAFGGITDAFVAKISEEPPSGPPPQILSVTPSSGPTTGQTQVIISGANFVAGADVSIGGLPARNVEVISASTIRAITEFRFRAGAVKVAIVNPDGQSSLLIDGYTYLATPHINNVIIQGKLLKVFGTGFDKNAVILIDGKEQETQNDFLNQTGSLIGKKKKTARKIKPGQSVTVQVRNSNGLLSQPFIYTRPVN